MESEPENPLPTPLEVAAELKLHSTHWLIERADMSPRQAVGPGGETAEVIDHVLMVRRRDD